MKTVELLKERYPDHIADEYSESRELSLAQFNGHDMIEFAEYYHKKKTEMNKNGITIHCNLTKSEFSERKRLLALQKDTNRWFSKEEFDRLRELSQKMQSHII